MTEKTESKPEILGLPKIRIEFETLTPEQRRKGEAGSKRVIENTNSWVSQMVDLLICYFSDTDTTVVDRTGLGFTAESTEGHKISTLHSILQGGVFVGTGLTAVDRDDIDIEIVIAHGNGAGQLEHIPGVVTKTVSITGGYETQCEKTFNNNSGGDITINEVGLVGLYESTLGLLKQALILHDRISPGHAVVNGGSVIVRYFLDWLA